MFRVFFSGSRAPNAESAFSTLVDNCHPWNVGLAKDTQNFRGCKGFDRCYLKMKCSRD